MVALLSVLFIVLCVYLLIGCMMALGLAMDGLVNPAKGPPFWLPFLVMVAWGPFMLWAYLVDGRKSQES